MLFLNYKFFNVNFMINLLFMLLYMKKKIFDFEF